MKKVYELVYYELYKPDFIYEEAFGLGYFESRERCLEEIETYYKYQTGFKEGTLKNYRITERIMDEIVVPEIIEDMKEREKSDQVPNKFWELVHGYDTTEEGYTVGSIVGVYSKIEYAKIMKKKVETWDIFKLHSEPHMDGEFHLDPIWLNKRWWVGGFIRGTPLSSDNFDQNLGVIRDPLEW